MTRLMRIAVSVMVFAFVVPAFAQVGLSGRWSGTYTLTFQVASCQNKTYTMSGNATVTFLQTGTLLSGRLDLTNALVFSGNSCSPATADATSAFIGSVNGANVTWHVANSVNGTVFAGTFDTAHLTGTITDAHGGSGSISLTRVAADPAATNLAGSWSGTYAFSDKCPSGNPSKAYSGQFTLALLQSAGVASGVVTMQNVPLYDQNCSTIALLNMSLSAVGMVNGSTFTGSVFDPTGSFDFEVSAPLSGGTIKGSVTGANQTSTTGTFTLTPSSTTTPASPFSGSFVGSYTEVDDERSLCLNVDFLRFAGQADVSIMQAGSAVSGYLVFEQPLSVTSDGFGNCSVETLTESVLPVYGTVDSSNNVSVLQPLGNGLISIVTNLGANAIAATVSDSFGDSATVDASRTTAAVPATVLTFGASPPVIAPGQKATLFWSASNATSVSLDHGLGTQLPAGSLTISPSATTTYTLTASGPGGSATSSITVVVAAAQNRRRAVRP